MKVLYIVIEPYAEIRDWSRASGGSEEMKFPKAEYKGEKTLGENNQNMQLIYVFKSMQFDLFKYSSLIIKYIF